LDDFWAGMGFFLPIMAQATTFPHHNSKYKHIILGLQDFFCDRKPSKINSFLWKTGFSRHFRNRCSIYPGNLQKTEKSTRHKILCRVDFSKAKIR
jgi:hypothetical protein